MPAPSLGTLQVGELYCNAATREVWLGVSTSVDAAGAILISDIEEIEVDIAAALASANSYTDAQVALKAPLSHTHAMSDVTGLIAALAGIGFTTGMIITWYGNLASIPVGWVLCDGTNGTPDLRGRFVMGAGGARPYGEAAGSELAASLGMTPAGAHSHGGATAYHTLNTAQIPPHAHGVTDPSHEHAFIDPGHNHGYMASGYAYGNIYSGGGAQWHDVGNGADSGVVGFTDTVGTGIDILHAHTGISINNAGGGEGHQHNITAEGAHQHTLTGNMLPPYLVLAYIMKL